MKEKIEVKIPPESIPNQTSKKPFSKSFYILISIILILGLSVAGFYYYLSNYLIPKSTVQTPIPTSPTPTPNPTANWKTYKNDKYNFEIKYPNDFKVGEALTKNYFAVTFSNEQPDYRINTGATIGVFVYEEKENTDLKTWIQQNSPYHPVPSISKPIIRTTLYKNGVIEGLSYESGAEATIKFVAYNKDQFIYLFSLSHGETGGSYKESTDGEKNFDQILSTFKFTNEIDTSSWKTYKNTAYGF